jgi:DNA-binding transcriptional regulator YiaG
MIYHLTCSDLTVLIREVRTCLGLTQEKFAAKLGVTLPTINRWENGRTKPSPLAFKNLRALIASLDEDGQNIIAKHMSDR